MADAASRRAARRKRILENSDDRMKKLFGTYGKEKQDEGHPEQSDTDQSPQEEPAKEITNTNSVRGERSRTPSPNTPSDDASAFSLLPESDQATATDNSHEVAGESDSSGLRLRIIQNQNSNWSENRQTESQHDQRIESSEMGPDAPEPQTLCTGKSLKRQTDVNKTAEALENAHQIGILRLRVVMFLAAAVIVRLVLMTGVGILYFQSTVLPFLVVEASLLMYLSSSPEGLLNLYGKSGGSLLTSALMLSGIQPRVITSYTNISMIFSMCFEDFAVYFFSFIMTHSLIQCSE